MAKNPQQLNQKQLDVLTWVRDGCPDGVYAEGSEHRITARALERRGLVSIGGRGPTWVATLTAAGRALTSEKPVTEASPDASEAALLLRQVADAGGSLSITATGDELKRWQRLLRLGLHSPSRPRGKQLTLAPVGYWGGKEQTISFTNYFEDFVIVHPVPVPEHVARYHPVVRSYLASKDWQYVSKEHLSRAARILQAVAAEAERRGMQALPPGKIEKNTGQPTYKPVEGHLWLVTERGEYSVEVREIPGKGGAKREYAGRFSSRTPKWIDRRQTDFISTGRLELILNGRFTPYEGQHFRDARTQTVEERLPAVFAALDKYLLEAEWSAKEAARKKEEEGRMREIALDRSRREFRRLKRWEYFEKLVEQHEEAARLRSFLDAADIAADTLVDSQRSVAQEYLAEIRASIDFKDAIESPELLVPVVPEPTESDLAQLVPKRNPFGLS